MTFTSSNGAVYLNTWRMTDKRVEEFLDLFANAGLEAAALFNALIDAKAEAAGVSIPKLRPITLAVRLPQCSGADA